jgi:hypothetical protein
VVLDISDSYILQCASKDASYQRSEVLQDNDHLHVDISLHGVIAKAAVADDVKPELYQSLTLKIPRYQPQLHLVEIGSPRY